MDYQRFLNETASYVDTLLLNERGQFSKKVDEFIEAFEHWKQCVIQGQRAALKDKSLIYSEDSPSKYGLPDYEVKSYNNFADYKGLDLVKVRYWTQILPPNPIDTLRPCDLFGILHPTNDRKDGDLATTERGFIAREPNDSEKATRRYFLLAIIQSKFGEVDSVVDKHSEIAELVWELYKDLDGSQSYYWGAGIRRLIKKALEVAKTELKVDDDIPRLEIYQETDTTAVSHDVTLSAVKDLIDESLGGTEDVLQSIENQPAQDDASLMSDEARVLAVYADNPDLNKTKIDEKAKVNRTQLYRMKKFSAVWDMKKAEDTESYKDSMPRGDKDGKTGQIEAWKNN